MHFSVNIVFLVQKRLLMLLIFVFVNSLPMFQHLPLLSTVDQWGSTLMLKHWGYKFICIHIGRTLSVEFACSFCASVDFLQIAQSS